MADMLVRGIPEKTKELLAQRAARNGRSQNAEALAILDEALKPERKTWFDMLRETVEEVGGVELELPERHPFREFTFEGA